MTIADPMTQTRLCPYLCQHQSDVTLLKSMLLPLIDMDQIVSKLQYWIWT